MRNSWDAIPIKPNDNEQYMIDLGHRTSVAIKQAAQDYQRQQLKESLRAMLTAHKAKKYGEWNIA
tara:strand:- start:625 stop:819 length:195 start_codon:yes stop_codon:yes gene_type:complete